MHTSELELDLVRSEMVINYYNEESRADTYHTVTQISGMSELETNLVMGWFLRTRIVIYCVIWNIIYRLIYIAVVVKALKYTCTDHWIDCPDQSRVVGDARVPIKRRS